MLPSPSIQRAFRCPDCGTFLVDGRVVEKRDPRPDTPSPDREPEPS
jgi:hypothetical protein